MKNSKLYKLYSLLTKKEKKKFARWLEAELNGKKWKLLVLRDSLDKGLSKEEVWEKLFPGEEFEDRKLRHQMKLLNALVEEFLSIIVYRKLRMEQEINLAGEIFRRNATELYDPVLNKIGKRLDAHPNRDERYFYYRYEYDLLKHQIARENEVKDPLKLLENVNDSFDSMLIIYKLKHALMNHSYQVKNIKLPTRFIEAITEEIERDSKMVQQPTIQMFFWSYKVVMDNKLEDAKTLQSKMKEFGSLLQLHDYRLLFNILINFYITLVNKGAKSLFHAMSDLYMEGINREILLTNGVLSSQHISNLISLGIREGEYVKSRDYLQQLVPKVAENLQEDVMIFNETKILFEEKKFREVINMTMQKGSAFRQGLMEIQSRLTVLKCWYEIDGYIEMSAIQNVIRVLDRRADLSDGRKAILRLSLKYFRELVRAFTIDDYRRLQFQIEQEKNFPEKRWLLAKTKAKIPE